MQHYFSYSWSGYSGWRHDLLFLPGCEWDGEDETDLQGHSEIPHFVCPVKCDNKNVLL